MWEHCFMHDARIPSSVLQGPLHQAASTNWSDSLPGRGRRLSTDQLLEPFWLLIPDLQTGLHVASMGWFVSAKHSHLAYDWENEPRSHWKRAHRPPCPVSTAGKFCSGLFCWVQRPCWHHRHGDKCSDPLLEGTRDACERNMWLEGILPLVLFLWATKNRI